MIYSLCHRSKSDLIILASPAITKQSQNIAEATRAVQRSEWNITSAVDKRKLILCKYNPTGLTCVLKHSSNRDETVRTKIVFFLDFEFWFEQWYTKYSFIFQPHRSSFDSWSLWHIVVVVYSNSVLVVLCPYAEF